MSPSADLSNPHSLSTHSPRLGQKKWKRKGERGKVVWLQLDDETSGNKDMSVLNSPSISVSIKDGLKKIGKGKMPRKDTYDRMLALAAHSLAKNKHEPKDLWQEPFVPASAWRPCADHRDWNPSEGNNGYILVTANGGMNQQRVAVCNAVVIAQSLNPTLVSVCNAVVIARLLNSSLVIPRFMYSSVWRDVSQFSHIYQEEHFINYLTPDIRIVKELPKELQSLDLEAIGSTVTDVDVPKESEPSFYLKSILPILLKNRVVHFVGFGNRLAFDPIPFQLQIQETGALLLQRLRKHATHPGSLDHYLTGPFAEPNLKGKVAHAVKASRYLAIHLRFEIDMLAHSLCEYGGGEEERKELEAYREIHFPALTHLKKTTELRSPALLRSEGLCPLTPEEAVLMLAALGFRRKTHMFIAGANIYGGRSRLTALTSLYPNLVTKEKLLSATELKPFMNFSSQVEIWSVYRKKSESSHACAFLIYAVIVWNWALRATRFIPQRLAALDFIACTASDAFAMTDSGSQLSSLVSGFRIYYGGGKMPTIRPNKRRLADIFMKNNTIEWKIFEQRVRKAVRQTKHVFERPKARSVYRYPRCKECMCLTE
ncbi:hypothetical protein H0E87_009434 [Populus deltoides]|uniref:O-fucosyltransferase family protein n=1 Tax=Populus deltoides TaxID=3696 RepID=A0A8T2Z4F5_POPDE|nr:hypothetical protein H0E87_009434 [Populus deltoides]